MAEDKENSYLTLKVAAQVLGKNEAALRARIKRGTMPAKTEPRFRSSERASARYRYLIPLEVVREELVRIVRSRPVLGRSSESAETMNLYQVACSILAKRPQGLGAEELLWHLERFYGLPLTVEQLTALLEPFEEICEGDRYRLPPALLNEMQPSAPVAEVPDGSAQQWIQDFERRLQALEAKIEMLVDLLAKRLTET